MPKSDVVKRTSLPLPGRKYSSYPQGSTVNQATPVNLLDYAYLPGRSGGQLLYGGQVETDTLTLNGSTAGGNVLLNANGGNTGVGEVDPASVFHVYNAAAVTQDWHGQSIYHLATSSTDDLIKVGLSIESSGAWTGSNAINVGLAVVADGGTTNYPLIALGGNSGFGTTTPGYLLDLAGGDLNIESGYGLRINGTAPTMHVLMGDGDRYVDHELVAGDLPEHTHVHVHSLATSWELGPEHTIDASAAHQVLVTTGTHTALFRALTRDDLPSTEQNFWQRDDDTDIIAPYTTGDNVQVDGKLYIADTDTYLEDTGSALKIFSNTGVLDLDDMVNLSANGLDYVLPSSIGAVGPYVLQSTAGGTLSWVDPAGLEVEAHDLVGALHTAAGLTTGHVLQALSATTFGFAAIPSHTHANDHVAVTLSAALGTNLLGLSTQELTLDTQSANLVFAGPASGAAAAPAFRALIDTDLGTGRSSGYYLSTNGSGTMTWVNPGAGHDAVTLSAALNSNLLSLSTQELGLDTQTANYVFAGPTSGAAAAPAFRALVSGDLPAHTHTELWARAGTTLSPTTAGDNAQITGGYVYLVDTSSYLYRSASAIALVTDKDYAVLAPGGSNGLIVRAATKTVYGGSADWQCGTTGTRWADVNSVLGNFTGQVTLSVATGTAPLAVTSITKVSNLNAGLLADQGNVGRAGSSASTANTVAIRDANADLVARYFNGTGFQVAGAAASGQYLRGNGTYAVFSAIQVADLPVGINADTVDTFHAQTATAANTCVVRDASQNINAAQATLNVATGTAPLVITSTTKVSNLNADLVDGYSAQTASAANTVAVRDSNQYLDAVRFANGGYYLAPAVATGTAPLSVASTTVCPNLNSHYLDGYHAGNSTGQVAVSNGTMCTNLNAQYLADTGNVGRLGSVDATGNTYVLRNGIGSITVANIYAEAVECYGVNSDTNVWSDTGFGIGSDSGVAGTFAVITALQYDGATLQKKSRSLTFAGGIITSLGSESGWVNV